MKLEPGYVKATGNLLPKCTEQMVAEYYNSEVKLCSAESRGVKDSRAGREAFGDKAIGFVQLQRVGAICKLRAAITPEHRIRSKPYTVELDIDEDEDRVVFTKCLDCAASLGGCKHAIAFLFWVHRRSEDESPTSTECYWKKSSLSKVLEPNINITTGELSPCHISRKEGTQRQSQPGSFLMKVINKGNILGTNSQLLRHHRALPAPESLTMHNLMFDFLERGGGDVDDFIKFCSSKMTSELCHLVERETMQQGSCSLWKKIRYGRATASRSLEISRCQTHDGSLVESILGASFKETEAMKRGRMLEPLVIDVLEKKIKKKIKNVGITLSGELPAIGASPDGRGDNFLVEIKSPSMTKTFSKYVTKDIEITPRYNAQVQLQMHMTKLDKTYYCVAAPDFEKSKKVTIIEVFYDKDYSLKLVQSIMEFWKIAVYPKLLTNCSN